MHSISIQSKFDAAHRITFHTGYCKFLHGHSYKVIIEIATSIDDEGKYEIDFSKLKDILSEILSKYEHAVLIYSEDKDLLDFCIKTNQKYVVFNNETTAEYLAKCLCIELQNKGLKPIKIELHEGLNNICIYRNQGIDNEK